MVTSYVKFIMKTVLEQDFLIAYNNALEFIATFASNVWKVLEVERLSTLKTKDGGSLLKICIKQKNYINLINQFVTSHCFSHI